MASFRKADSAIYCGKRHLNPLNQDDPQFVTVDKVFTSDEGEILYTIVSDHAWNFLVSSTELQAVPKDKFFAWGRNVMMLLEGSAVVFCRFERDGLAANLAVLLNRDAEKWAADFAERGHDRNGTA